MTSCTKTVIWVILGFIFIEVSVRLFLCCYFGISIFHPENFLYQFYPNLALQETYKYENDKTNLLVLGGSTLYADTLRFSDNNTKYAIHFCNTAALLNDKMTINGLSLAYPANTILDCLYEYRFLENKKFDYVLLYNGINDTRANNIAPQKFDPHYRHIEFYDDLAIYERHPEISFAILPFIIDWCQHIIAKQIGKNHYLPKENLQALRTIEGRNEFLYFGDSIKTTAAFKINLYAIKKIADKRKQKLIVCSFAWYQTDEYSYKMFTEKKLDYTQSIFPTELYGEPLNVIKGINIHNHVIRQFAASHPDVIFVDAENLIPKNGKYFNDVCHLSDEGCAILSGSVAKALTTSLTQ